MTTTSTTASKRRRLRSSSRINPGFLSLSVALALFALATTRTTTRKFFFALSSLVPSSRSPSSSFRPLQLPSSLAASPSTSPPFAAHGEQPRCHCTALCLARAPVRPVLPSPIYTRIPPRWGLAPRTRFSLVTRAGLVPNLANNFQREGQRQRRPEQAKSGEPVFRGRDAQAGRRQQHTTALHALRTRTICRRHDASDAWRRDAHPRSRPPRGDASACERYSRP